VVDLNSSDLELVVDAGGNQTVALRFTNIAIPATATITNAYVQFEADEVTTASCTLTLTGKRVANSTPFATTPFSLSSRARTTSSVTWAPAPWPTAQVAGVDQRTPNLAPIVSEILSQPGWASGNALTLLVNGVGKRTAEAANGTRAPVLVIEYQ